MNDGVFAFRNDAKNINEYFAELNYQEDAQGVPMVLGDLVLKDENGVFIDSYSIKIVATECYPFCFPWVYETGERVPINNDWHVFLDGHCCIKAFQEEILLCKKGISLVWFIKEQVVPYFFNQKYREQNGFFLHERSHGRLGDLEFFKQYFNTQDIQLTIDLLKETQKINERKSNSKCLCGSKKKFRKCHRRSLRALRIFPKSWIQGLISSFSN